LALLELHRRFGADVVIGRAFQQAGPGQIPDYVIPALARRILEARARGLRTIAAGDLVPTREFVDVRDTAAALRALLERGEAGGVYNIAVGQGLTLSEVFRMLTTIAGWDCEVVADPGLLRAGDIRYLVGDGSRIASLGWKPRFALTDTLRDIVESLGDPGETPRH
jgi:nucleoside-diphosphate-sugar epimerase